MFHLSKKYICLFTVLIIISYSILPLFPMPGTIQKAEAAFENKDVYQGLALALLLIFISKIGQARSNDNNDQQPPVIPDIPDSISDSELEMLARIIHAEARGEIFQGQVAVGAVVLNRVKSPDFPNTIKEVVYQAKQFTSVTDGQINLYPNENAFSAAREALSGVDPSNGALFFYNPKTATTLWWLSQRQTTVTIGNHVFAK